MAHKQNPTTLKILQNQRKQPIQTLHSGSPFQGQRRKIKTPLRRPKEHKLRQEAKLIYKTLSSQDFLRTATSRLMLPSKGQQSTTLIKTIDQFPSPLKTMNSARLTPIKPQPSLKKAQLIAQAPLPKINIRNNIKKPFEVKFLLEFHTNTINAMDFSNDFLIACSSDYSLSAWPKSSLTSRQLINKIHLVPIQTVRAHKRKINTVRTINSDIVASGSGDNAIKLWNSLFELKGIFKCHNSPVNCLIPMDNKVVSAGSDLKFWDSERLKVISEYKTHSINKLLELSESAFASGSNSGTLSIWDVRMGNTTCSVQAHNGPVMALDGFKDQVVSGSNDGVVHTWEANTLRLVKSCDVSEDVSFIGHYANYMVTGGSQHCRWGNTKLPFSAKCFATCHDLMLLGGHSGLIKAISL